MGRKNVESHHTSLRVPAAVWEQIQKQAESEKVYTSTLIIRVLSDAYSQDRAAISDGFLELRKSLERSTDVIASKIDSKHIEMLTTLHGLVAALEKLPKPSRTTPTFPGHKESS